MSTTAQTISVNHLAPFTGFTKVREEKIESLDIKMVEYRHDKTGAVHYHLDSENDENVFLVAFKTVPMDSTGVAHILEHTSLCGSERFPVRDPFFMMIRRSLNTFMNAFTSSDWTAYPFASKNKKDFNNLLDVYLDAVFFARLDPLDFAQEGHRLEFEVMDDPNSNLLYKGVVFNEMKGAMSSPVSTVYDLLSRYLFSTTTYHYNSGGDPESIPDLTYDSLQEFYKTHYHPSNAVFMTYGDIPPAEHQENFQQKALHRFDRLEHSICVSNEKRRLAPLAVEEVYAVEEDAEANPPQNKTHLVVGWLLGKSTDIEERLRCQLLSDVLLDNSASPLRHALETTNLGTAPSRLCGLEDSNREMSFMCGLEGSNPDQARAFEKLVLECLEKVVREGVPQEDVEAMLHQLELHQREVGGGGYPYGMQLILSGLSTAIHGGDPVASLNIDPVLDKLRQEIKDPKFISNLVAQKLLHNQHRVLLTVKPDSELNNKKQLAEAEKLAQIKQSLTASEKQEIVALASALEKRQELNDDDSILPKVGLEDVPESLSVPDGQSEDVAGLPLELYEQGTNGIIYQQVIYELPNLNEELLSVLPIYTSCVSELGIAGKDYLQVQSLQSRYTGGLSAYSSMRGAVDDEQAVKGYLVYSSKALARNVEPMSELLWQTINEVEFSEHNRLAELIAQQRAQMDQAITGNGHGLAMLAACSGMSPTAALGHRTSGLAGISAIRQLDDSFKSVSEGESNIAHLASKLSQVHELVKSAPKRFLLVGEKASLTSASAALKKYWQKEAAKDETMAGLSLAPVREQVKQIWLTSTQVNFVAKAYPSVPVEHEDSAALTVLGGYLRNGYLHTAIREKGGAYGSGALQDSATASFKFFSYRDPRMAETLKDFQSALDWLQQGEYEARLLEEAILGVVSDIDKPSSPAGEAKQAFHNKLFGRTAEQRRRFRSRVLQVTQQDLLRVANTYLTEDRASIAIITNKAHVDREGDLGLQVFQL